MNSIRDLNPSSQTTNISPGVVQLPDRFCRSCHIGSGKSRFNTVLKAGKYPLISLCLCGVTGPVIMSAVTEYS